MQLEAVPHWALTGCRDFEPKKNNSREVKRTMMVIGMNFRMDLMIITLGIELEIQPLFSLGWKVAQQSGLAGAIGK